VPYRLTYCWNVGHVNHRVYRVNSTCICGLGLLTRVWFDVYSYHYVRVGSLPTVSFITHFITVKPFNLASVKLCELEPEVNFCTLKFVKFSSVVLVKLSYTWLFATFKFAFFFVSQEPLQNKGRANTEGLWWVITLKSLKFLNNGLPLPRRLCFQFHRR